MRAVLLASMLAIPASAAPPPLFLEPAAPVPVLPAAPGDKSVINPNPGVALGLCPPTAAQMAADRAGKSGGPDLFHNLTELPATNLYSAVYREVNGCESPIVIRYDINNSRGTAHK